MERGDCWGAKRAGPWALGAAAMIGFAEIRATTVDHLADPEPAVLLPLGIAVGDRGEEESEPHEDWGEGAKRTDDRSHLVLVETKPMAA